KQMRTSTSATTLSGIAEQSVALERDLKKCEDDLLAFQATNSVVFLQEQGNSAGSYLVQLTRQLAQLKTEHQLLNMLELDQNREQLENRRNSISIQIANLEREIKEWEVKSLDVSKKMAEYERIRANKQRVQTLYDRLLAAMQTLGVDKDINQESVTVLERASAA